MPIIQPPEAGGFVIQGQHGLHSNSLSFSFPPSLSLSSFPSHLSLLSLQQLFIFLTGIHVKLPLAPPSLPLLQVPPFCWRDALPWFQLTCYRRLKSTSDGPTWICTYLMLRLPILTPTPALPPSSWSSQNRAITPHPMKMEWSNDSKEWNSAGRNHIYTKCEGIENVQKNIFVKLVFFFFWFFSVYCMKELH
jgi:hypothetical protein